MMNKESIWKVIIGDKAVIIDWNQIVKDNTGYMKKFYFILLCK